jgi:purine-binding chemotaxis protein CheW
MAQQDDDSELLDDESGSLEATFLTFLLGAEEYAVPVRHVTEIVRLQKSFGLPDVPAYVRGVINLRGKVIPLLDVRGRFGMPDAAYTDRTVVVVVEHDGSSTGLVVDAVSEVSEIPPDKIEARSKIGHAHGAALVSGVGLRERGVVFVLDLPALVSSLDAAGPGRAPSGAMAAGGDEA